MKKCKTEGCPVILEVEPHTRKQYCDACRVARIRNQQREHYHRNRDHYRRNRPRKTPPKGFEYDDSGFCVVVLHSRCAWRDGPFINATKAQDAARSHAVHCA